MSKLIVWLVCVTALGAQTSEERGKRVVMDALAALGGDKFLAMEDRLEEGRAYSFYREELTGLSYARIYTRYLTLAPSSGEIGQRVRQAFGKKEDAGTVLFSEKGEGWDVTFRGARPLPQATLDRYRDTTLHDIFYLLRQRLNEKGLIFESRGADVFENQPVEIVDITDAENRVVTVYFHQSTKVPVRQIFYRRDPQTRERNQEVTIYSKYRDVGGGVQWPCTILRERNGEKIFQMFSDSVEINKNLTDNLFTLPSNIKVLK